MLDVDTFSGYDGRTETDWSRDAGDGLADGGSNTMPLIDSAPARVLDPLQSVLLHLPGGMYGAYQALCDYVGLDPAVPEGVKEGLRYLSATRVGCAFCVTVRLPGAGGARLLPDDFYDAIAAGRTDWDAITPPGWDDIFRMADEVLIDGVVSAGTGREMKARHTDAQIVEALFYMLLIGASHRLSRALGIDAVCLVPTTMQAALDATPMVLSHGTDG